MSMVRIWRQSTNWKVLKFQNVVVVVVDKPDDVETSVRCLNKLRRTSQYALHIGRF